MIVSCGISESRNATRLHNDLRFNTVVGTASSTGVNTKAARLLVCLLGATGFTTSASGSSAAPCDWSEEQTQTYLSGCTAGLCFQYVYQLCL